MQVEIFVEDYFHRKAVNTNSAVLKFVIKFARSIMIFSKRYIAGGDFYANQNSARIFCNSLIVKNSRKNTEIQLENGVLNCEKMATIFCTQK